MVADGLPSCGVWDVGIFDTPVDSVVKCYE
jgi:hypothetical protein